MLFTDKFIQENIKKGLILETRYGVRLTSKYVEKLQQAFFQLIDEKFFPLLNQGIGLNGDNELTRSNILTKSQTTRKDGYIFGIMTSKRNTIFEIERKTTETNNLTEAENFQQIQYTQEQKISRLELHLLNPLQRITIVSEEDEKGKAVYFTHSQKSLEHISASTRKSYPQYNIEILTQDQLINEGILPIKSNLERIRNLLYDKSAAK